MQTAPVSVDHLGPSLEIINHEPLDRIPAELVEDVVQRYLPSDEPTAVEVPVAAFSSFL